MVPSQLNIQNAEDLSWELGRRMKNSLEIHAREE
jgi:hypothetical protein